YWMHANMLTLNGKKMAKSTGNNITPSEIYNGGTPFLSKTFSPNVARFFMMQAHYRSILDFTNEGILAAEKGYNRLMEALESLNNLEAKNNTTFASDTIEIWKTACYEAMNDDFNTPILIAHLFGGVNMINLLKNDSESLNKEDLQNFKNAMNAFVFDVLGLKNEKAINDNNDKLEGVVEMLIGMRNEARANKNFALSDQIRDQLLALGIQLKDGKEGTTFSIQ
ncbi:MAG: DALR domain-containing protein, partial [Flavobacterium sp.]